MTVNYLFYFSLKISDGSKLRVEDAGVVGIGLQSLSLSKNSQSTYTGTASLYILQEASLENSQANKRQTILNGNINVLDQANAAVFATSKVHHLVVGGKMLGNLVQVFNTGSDSTHSFEKRRMLKSKYGYPLGNSRMLTTFSDDVIIIGTRVVDSEEIFEGRVFCTGTLEITETGSVFFQDYSLLVGTVSNKGSFTVSSRGNVGRVLLGGVYSGDGDVSVDNRAELHMTGDIEIGGDFLNEGKRPELAR